MKMLYLHCCSCFKLILYIWGEDNTEDCSTGISVACSIPLTLVQAGNNKDRKVFVTNNL